MTRHTREALAKVYGILLREGWDGPGDEGGSRAKRPPRPAPASPVTSEDLERVDHRLGRIERAVKDLKGRPASEAPQRYKEKVRGH